MSKRRSSDTYDSYKHERYKRKRSRSHSPSTSRNTRAAPDELVDFYDYKNELQTYLFDNFQIKQSEDFFRFYTKYLAAHKHKQSTIASATSEIDRNKLFPITFSKPTHVLIDKFPIYKRNGNKLPSNARSIEVLLEALRTYQDFQQKTKFAKLKQLRKTQQDLPIAAYKQEIVHELRQPGVLLIAGDTGCGKSTQLPQYVLDAGFTRVAVTQPRRLACVSLANRVAFETLSAYKNQIGYQIRFEKQKNRQSRVIFLTEGILLRQAADGDVLASYDAIILDEVHERHLNMDFLVGIMKCLVRQRSNLKLILMSATINLELFQAYFAHEQVKTIQVPGRLYPIEIVYKPTLKDVYDPKRKDNFDCQQYLNVLELIDAKYKPHEKGDVLVFLQGLQEIQRLSSAVEDYAMAKKNWIVLQLHSTLSLEEQDKVFYQAPENTRKCIISTNIAETSVTIDGVRFVIDSGKCNRMRYESCVSRLYTTDISQDSAKQRAGRAGRTGPGYCYRLYSEEQMSKFDSFTPGEIHLVPLENLVLNMITLGLSDVQKFPFLEKPADEKLAQAVDRLLFLEALGKNPEGLALTTLGDAMAKLPVDLTIGKMLITSTLFDCVDAALTMASLLSVQNPLNETRFFDTRESREPFVSNHGEPLTLLNLYIAWLEVKLNASSYDRNRKDGDSRRWCRSRGLEEQRFYEVTKLVHQFREILQDAELLAKFDADISGQERQIRHGELKQLKKLRAQLKTDSKSTVRKLKHNADSDDDLDAKDIKDVEFRITNDFSKVQHLIDRTQSNSHQDLTLLKLLLTSALYPQVAVEDEHNSSKTVNDRLYHTKYKNYVFLRPTSYFADHPDFFNIPDPEVEVPPVGYFSKKPLSAKHQVLVYQKLLEIKKTFLMNVYRMPALQTLLLFGKKVAVNRSFTKFAVDDFLYLEVPFIAQGIKLLLEAVNLRKRIQDLLEAKLSKELKDHDDALLCDLVQFVSTQAVYNIKRLLPADVKHIYSGDLSDSDPVEKENPFLEDYPIKPHELGGVCVTPNVIYDCLDIDAYDVEVESAILEPRCSKCENVSLSMWEYLVHTRIKCREPKKVPNPEKSQDAIPGTSTSGGNLKTYKCDKCAKELKMTPVEFLKHKRHCVPIKQEQNN